jgi:carbonic anhydrase
MTYSPRDMNVTAVETAADITAQYRGTPIADLLEYHNLDRPFDTYTTARLLVGMCMDSRKHLKIPENFSFIIRSGGANLRYSEFKVSYAIACGGVRAIALMGHTNCGMVNLAGRRDMFIDGLVENAGWTRDQAVEHFNTLAPMFEIGNEIEFIGLEAKRLRVRYPKIIVCPMMYKLEDNRLYLIPEQAE